MIRVLLGSALPVLGLAAAASFLGPDLLSGPRGEPLVMVTPDQAVLQPASFDGSACNSTLVFADPADGASAAQLGIRIVVFALPTESDDVAIAVEDIPIAPAAPKTVVLVFDEAGRLLSAGDPTSLQVQAAAALADCIKGSKADARAPI